MKKLVLTLGLLLGIAFGAAAQFSLGGLMRSSNQQFVEEALSQSLMVMRQEYQLEDTLTMQRYSWNKRREFGAAESFAVRTTTGYITHRDLLEPWQKDSHYAPYRGGNLRPVLTRTEVRTLKDSLWREVGIIAPMRQEPIENSSWCRVADTLFSQQGVRIELLMGEQEGWLVWLTASNEADLASANLSMVSYRHTLTLSQEKSSYEIPEPAAKEQPLGGIFVVPSFDGCGTITFLLQGVVVKEERGWSLHLLGETAPSEELATPIEEGELTPVPTEAEKPLEEAPTEGIIEEPSPVGEESHSGQDSIKPKM